MNRPVLPRSAPRATAEEVVLFVRKAKQGDLFAQDEIVRANMGFVYNNARKIARNIHSVKVDPDDLVQEGVMGIFRAIKKYDEAYGVKFLTYCAFWILQFMMRFVERAESAALAGTTHLVVKYGRKLKEYDRLVTSGNNPAKVVIALAKEIGIEPAKLVEHFNALRTLKVASLDAPIGTLDDGTATLLDKLPSGDFELENTLGDKARDNRVKKAIAALRPKLSKLEKTTLDLRVYPVDGKERTLQEIGEIAGRTRERVRQVEQSLLKKIKGAIVRLDIQTEDRRKKRLRDSRLTDKGPREED